VKSVVFCYTNANHEPSVNVELCTQKYLPEKWKIAFKVLLVVLIGHAVYFLRINLQND